MVLPTSTSKKVENVTIVSFIVWGGYNVVINLKSIDGCGNMGMLLKRS